MLSPKNISDHGQMNVCVYVWCQLVGPTYGLETLALYELHQHKLQVCENNWIRRIAGVKRVERRIMKNLREEVGTKACIVGKIVKANI